MTNDQNRDFLAQLRVDLENRYTEKDSEYIKCFNERMPDPPILKIVFKKMRYHDNKQWTSNSPSRYKDTNYGYKNNRQNNNGYSTYKRDHNNHHNGSRNTYNNYNNRPNLNQN